MAEALKRSRHNPEIISISPGRNPGIKKLASEQYLAEATDITKIIDIAKKTKPDFAVIGPEEPLAAGVSDALAEIAIPVVGPTKKLAQIESSKGFTRSLLHKYGIHANPECESFSEPDPVKIQKYLEQNLQGEYVVKYDALKGGKGVKLSGEHLFSIKEAVDYAVKCIKECGRVVLEEKLAGVEFSLISFVSGLNTIDTPAVQDHKRAYEGDSGPNTGGMGTYSDSNLSLPFLTENDLKQASEINRLTAKALMEECGEPYKGFLYGGFIAVKDGIKLIEYNARLGDPEALNILPLLSSDFVDICQAIINGELSDNLVVFENKATVCKYITPECYPVKKDLKGEIIELPQAGRNIHIYYGDVSEDQDGTLHLGSSRAIGITGVGHSISKAEQAAEKFCKMVKGPVRFRSDIGTDELIKKRIDLLSTLRA